MTEPQANVAVSYLAEAERTLSKIKPLIDEGDFVWADVRIYYCAYYSIYSFLQRIGIKSENHDCAIGLAEELLGKELLKNMELFRKNRIHSQYYLKTGQKSRLIENYSLAKKFYLKFKEIISRMSDEDVKNYRNKIKELMNE